MFKLLLTFYILTCRLYNILNSFAKYRLHLIMPKAHNIITWFLPPYGALLNALMFSIQLVLRCVPISLSYVENIVC